jgi:hypothetical protein
MEALKAKELDGLKRLISTIKKNGRISQMNKAKWYDPI